MVHALNEVRRVLRPGGLLIDLRPLLDRWPLEVAWSGGYEEAGRATDLKEPLGDDVAANAAMGEAVGGPFHREMQEEFAFFYYWDTPKEMEEYIGEEWSDVITVEEGAWATLRSRWAIANPDARVRLRMKMSIARYRKE